MYAVERLDCRPVVRCFLVLWENQSICERDGTFLAPGSTFNSRISVFDAHSHATLLLSQWPLGSCFIRGMVH